MNQREGIKYTLSHTDKRKGGGGGGGAKHFTAQTHMHAIRKKERGKKERKKEKKRKEKQASKNSKRKETGRKETGWMEGRTEGRKEQLKNG